MRCPAVLPGCTGAGPSGAGGSVYLLAWAGAVAAGHVLVTPMSKYPEIREQLGRFPEVNGLHVADSYRRRAWPGLS